MQTEYPIKLNRLFWDREASFLTIYCCKAVTVKLVRVLQQAVVYFLRGSQQGMLTSYRVFLEY